MPIYTAYETRVIDGDTIEVRYRTDTIKIRLDNIDTAERGRAGAVAATNCLKDLIEGQQVTIKETGKSGDRVRAHVWRASDGLAVNQEMVNRGHSIWVEYP